MGERPQKNAVKRLTSRIGGATRKESPMIAMHRPSSGELLHRAIIGMQPLLPTLSLAG